MKKNRLLALFTALVLVISTMLSSVSFAAENTDVAGTDFEGVVGKLNAVGVMNGYPDGTFRPEGEITRAEFAAIAIRALGLGDAAELSVANTKFSDVTYSHWASGYINLAADRGILTGFPDGTFKPDAKLTNAQAITILVRLIGLGPVVDKQGTWPANYVSAANINGILDDVVVASNVNATRGNAAKMLVNTLEAEKWGPDGYNDDGTVNYRGLGVSLLTDNLGIKQIKGDILTDVSEDEIEFLIDGEYDYVGEEVDKAALFLNLVDAWVDTDEDEVIYVVDVSDDVVYDAIEIKLDDKEVKAIQADKTYDLYEDKDDDVEVEVYVNGKSKDIDDLNGNKYDYAKLVLDDKNDVVAINAYDWNGYIVVEEVDDYDVFGYGDELDVEDYTIIKDGVTISVDDVEEGDILFYNKDAEYAEVFNRTVSGEITEIFSSKFEIDDDDEYDYNGYYLDGDDLVAFDDNAADSMKDENESVTVFLDRKGNVVFVDGEVDVEETSTVAGVLYEEMEGYKDVRGDHHLEFKVVNQNGEKVTHDVVVEDLTSVTINATEYKVKDLATIAFDDDAVAGSPLDIGLDAQTITFATDGAKGRVVAFEFNEDEDIVDIEFFPATSTTADVASDAKYIDSLKTSSSVPVFFTEGTWDKDDVEVTTFGELDEFVIEKYVAYENNGKDLKYLVITQSDLQDTTANLAVLTDVRYNKDDELYRVSAIIDDEEVTLYTNDPEDFSSFSSVAGEAVEIVTYDANGKISAINTVTIAANEKFTTDSNFDVEVRDRKITDGTDTWKLVSDGSVVDISDTSDVKTMSLGDLDEIKAGTDIAIVLDEGTYYAKYVLVGAEPSNGGGGSTEFDGTIAFVDFDFATDNTVRITVDGKDKSYSIDTNAILLDKNGDEATTVTVLPVGTKVNFITIEGTDTIDVITAVDLDLAAPKAAVLTDLTVTATGFTGVNLEAGATVKVVADGDSATDVAVATATVDSDGNVTITGLTTSTSYEVFVIDAAGNASAGLGITTP